MRFVSYIGTVSIAAMIAATPAAAASDDNRAYTPGRFAVDIAGGEAGWVASVEGGGEDNVTLEPQDLLACKSFAGTVCDRQYLFADSSNFTNGTDIFDVIGFSYNPGNCCQFLYFYFPNETFATKGFYQSISQGPFATLQITSVPEPDNWALLIVGFGLIGAILRRSRHAAA